MHIFRVVVMFFVLYVEILRFKYPNSFVNFLFVVGGFENNTNKVENKL